MRGRWVEGAGKVTMVDVEMGVARITNSDGWTDVDYRSANQDLVLSCLRSGDMVVAYVGFDGSLLWLSRVAGSEGLDDQCCGYAGSNRCCKEYSIGPDDPIFRALKTNIEYLMENLDGNDYEMNYLLLENMLMIIEDAD